MWILGSSEPDVNVVTGVPGIYGKLANFLGSCRSIFIRGRRNRGIGGAARLGKVFQATASASDYTEFADHYRACSEDIVLTYQHAR
jgi:hypothetical protein